MTTNEQTSIYHKDLGFPKNIRWPQGRFKLQYSLHAIEEARTDKYGDFESRLPKEIIMSDFQMVEAQILDGRLVKEMVLRRPLDTLYDMVVVIITGGLKWVVKTVYLNRRCDQHRTLDLLRYQRAID